MPSIAHPRSSNSVIFSAFSWDYHGIQSNWHSDEEKSKQSSTVFRRDQYKPKLSRYSWTDLCSVTLTSQCTTQKFRDSSVVFIFSGCFCFPSSLLSAGTKLELQKTNKQKRMERGRKSDYIGREHKKRRKMRPIWKNGAWQSDKNSYYKLSLSENRW